MSISDHHKIHIDTATKNLPQNSNEEFYYRKGRKLWVVPHLEEITNVQKFDETDVYDVVIDHPEIHNFIANNYVVHNCGKTLEAMNLALYNKQFNKVKHCLIVACVNSAKYNWIADIEKHTNFEQHPYLLGSRLKRDGTVREGGSADKLKDLMCGHVYGKKEYEPLPYFLVINIEAFHYKQNRHYVIRERLTELINKGYIGMVILDEIHRNCLFYDTEIETNLGMLKIGDIVRNRLSVKVRSYNTNTGMVEWKPVINWIENCGVSELMELTIDTPNGMKTIRCTPDHKFYTKNRGWVCAKDLCDTDDIVYN
jgi:hypothetical protein